MTRMTMRRVWVWGCGISMCLWCGGRALLPELVVYAPSASLPKGWYLRDFATRDLAIGDLVVVAMPEGMRLAAASPKIAGLPARLLKHVAGLPGDRVCWEAHAMTVSTTHGTVTYPYHAEAGVGREPGSCLTLPREALVIVGTHPRSFDSRYLGVVDGRLLQFRVRPLWTWEAT